ncbi:MAG: tRNA (adenosine(37)-N6)-dimethylallyltransferase MiaA [Candidatus Omnitrophica bacterium]|nr:tRNA (adenosine(37)-N6)-dimethylallyltransferase MiaA [Candidatus Omnitrophota bacterium]
MPLKFKKSIIIFIVGPTAIGKTRLAVKLAKRIHGEIISCDSMQVYKGMRILNQVPTISERNGIKHHLAGVTDPEKEYNAAIFSKKAVRSIRSIIKKRKVPIVVGGSGLYAKALIDGIFPSPKADSAFRSDMNAFVARHGSPRLYKRLSKIDASAAKAIHPNDARRTIRALEIYHSTGKTMTELKRETKGLTDTNDIRIFGFTMPREDIYENINRRVDKMFGEGIVNEVKALKKRNLSKTAKAVLGFKEITGYLDGENDLETARKLLKRNTRRFAKRQLTWFRADKRVKWFDLKKYNDSAIIKNITKEVV